MWSQGKFEDSPEPRSATPAVMDFGLEGPCFHFLGCSSAGGAWSQPCEAMQGSGSKLFLSIGEYSRLSLDGVLAKITPPKRFKPGGRV